MALPSFLAPGPPFCKAITGHGNIKKLNTTTITHKKSLASVIQTSIVTPRQTFGTLNPIFRWWVFIKLCEKQTDIFCFIVFICVIPVFFKLFSSRHIFHRQIFSRPLKKDLHLESISDFAIFPQKSRCSLKKKKKVFTSISSLISLFFSQNQGVL